MSSVTLVAKSKLPTPWGTFTLVGFQEAGTGKDHAALVMGDVQAMSQCWAVFTLNA